MLKTATGSAVSSGSWERNLCATTSGSQARPKTDQKSFGIAGSDYQSGYRRENQSVEDIDNIAKRLILNGAPSRIRTCDPCLRRAVLYPAELWARDDVTSCRMAWIAEWPANSAAILPARPLAVQPRLGVATAFAMPSRDYTETDASPINDRRRGRHALDTFLSDSGASAGPVFDDLAGNRRPDRRKNPMTT